VELTLDALGGVHGTLARAPVGADGAPAGKPVRYIVASADDDDADAHAPLVVLLPDQARPGTLRPRTRRQGARGTVAVRSRCVGRVQWRHWYGAW
jgi:hypothetical protein